MSVSSVKLGEFEIYQFGGNRRFFKHQFADAQSGDVLPTFEQAQMSVPMGQFPGRGEEGTISSMRKRTPRSSLPHGLVILYEDQDILVVDKPAGLLTIGTERDKSRTAYFILTDYVRKGAAR